MLNAILIVAAVGLTGTDMIRNRVLADSVSAATSLAEKRVEELRALSDPDTHPDLAAGRHGPHSIDEAGNPSLGGPYEIEWEVTDGIPHAAGKRIEVFVTHVSDPRTQVGVVTHYKAS